MTDSSAYITHMLGLLTLTVTDDLRFVQVLDSHMFSARLQLSQHNL